MPSQRNQQKISREDLHRITHLSPFGPVTIVTRGKHVLRVDLNSRTSGRSRPSHYTIQALNFMKDYFLGKKPTCRLAVDLAVLSGFKQKVFSATRKNPYGETRSYSSLARAIGKPRACRAVGQALAKNPLPIIIPCHRVVQKNGSLGGFTGGVNWKKRLLELEKRP